MYKYILLFTIAMVYACSSDKKNLEPGQVLLPVSQQTEIRYFEDRFEVKCILSLETSDSFLISQIKKVITCKDKIILFCSKGNTVFIIDSSTGHILKSIRNQGSGPGESNIIMDIAFDDSSEHILIHNDYGKLLTYDMQGTFLKEENVEGLYGNITCDNGEVIFYNRLEGYSCYPYELKVYDLKNKSWREKGEDKKIDFPIRSQGLQMVKSKRIWFTALLDFKMCVFENDEIKDLYLVDIPNSGLNENLIKRSISDPLSFFQEVGANNIIYNIHSIRETENYLIFRSNQGDIFLINKNEENVYGRKITNEHAWDITVADYYPHEGDDNKIMLIIPAEKWIRHKDTYLIDIEENLKQEIELLEISEDSNPILIFYKEKPLAVA